LLCHADPSFIENPYLSRRYSLLSRHKMCFALAIKIYFSPLLEPFASDVL
jgi:hypothetical protein